jgi:ubiquinone/menaquinone biosynthesis C-methylase UbiE
LALFRKSGGPYDFAVSMCGVHIGDRLLQIGCGDGGLFAALAAKTGLSGRACAVDDEAGVGRAQSAAARAGVLVEARAAPLTALPYEDEGFDLVVIRDVLGGLSPYERVRTLQEAHRVLRGAGRCVVIDRSPRAGLGRLLGGGGKPATGYQAAGGAERALDAEGFKAIRRIAERDGFIFIEGAKPRA